MQNFREQLKQFRARVSRTKVTFEVSPRRKVTVYRTIFVGGHEVLCEALLREGLLQDEALGAIRVIEAEPNLPALLRHFDPSGSPKRRATDEVAIAASAPAA